MLDIKTLRRTLAKKIDDLVADAGEISCKIDGDFGEASPEGYLFNAILIALEKAYTIAAESEQAAETQFEMTILPPYRWSCKNTLTEEK